MTLAVALTWRLWAGGGQAFLLDMPWPEHFQLRDVLQTVRPDGTLAANASSGMPVMLLLALTSYVLTAALVQKLLLTVLLAVAGICMWQLAGHIYQYTKPAPRITYQIMAGTLYVLNPYCVDRLWAGQWRVLAGYAVAPLVLWAVLRYAHAPTDRRLLLIAWLYALYPMLSQHWWFIATVCLAPWALTAGWRSIKQGAGRTIARRVAVLAGIFAAVNGWWLALAFGPYAAYGQLQPSDATFFPVTTTLPGGAVGSVLGLGGFWYHPYDFWPGTHRAWLLYAAGLIGCSFVGLRCLRQHKNTATLYAGLLLTAVLAAGLVLLTSVSALQANVQTVMRHVPGVVGLRETTKLVGLLAFGYALLAPLGLHVAVRHVQLRALRAAAPVATVTVLLVLMAPALQASRLQPHSYPATWHQANHYMRQVHARRVLAVPYVGYTRLPFAGHALVASPVQLFFDPVMLVGTSTGNPQLDASRNRQQNGLEQLAQNVTTGTVTADALQVYDIDFVLLSKQSGWSVPSNSALQTVYENQDWAIMNVK